MKSERSRLPLESEEQATVVQWLELKGLKFTSIPNSTWTTSKRQKMLNRITGLRAGLPDLLIVHGGNILFVEMKRRKEGRLSESQRGWIDALNTVGNCQAVVCAGAEEAIATISRILKIR